MIVPVIQARLGSTRFPEKVLAKVAGKVMVDRVIMAARLAFRVDPLIVTGDRSPVKRRMGIHPIVGPEDDVLQRFVNVADTFALGDFDVIVRLTADDPFKHPPLLRETARLCGRLYPYVQSNHGQVEGVGCEAFTVRLLREAHERREPDEAEHVTPGMARRYLSPRVSLTVDTREDLERLTT